MRLLEAMVVACALCSLTHTQDPADADAAAPASSPQDACNLIGLAHEGHCYWAPPSKGGKVKGDDLAAACTFLGGAPFSADTDDEWDFIKEFAHEIFDRVGGKLKKLFVAGSAPSDEAGLGDYSSGSNGDKCLIYKKNKKGGGKFKERKCKKPAQVICETEDLSTIAHLLESGMGPLEP